MKKEIKTLIAEKKLTDEFILSALESALLAESPDAEDQVDQPADDDPADSEMDEEDDQETVDSDATGNEEQPEKDDIRTLVQSVIADELAKMRRGKKTPPKVVKKATVKKTPPKSVFDNFGTVY